MLIFASWAETRVLLEFLVCRSLVQKFIVLQRLMRRPAVRCWCCYIKPVVG